MKGKTIILMTACGLLLAGGCKPTEKNYQAAYEAAQKKKKSDAAADPDMDIPAAGLQRLDAPRQMEVNGITLNLKRFFIKYVGTGETPAMQRYKVAVARYKMATNARAQAEDLVARQYAAFPAEGNDGYFYVIAGMFNTLEETADFVKEYDKTHEAGTFVGLEGAPLVID